MAGQFESLFLKVDCCVLLEVETESSKPGKGTGVMTLSFRSSRPGLGVDR